MKKISTILSFLFFALYSFGQCMPDGTVTTWGMHPGATVDLQGLGAVPEIPACIDESYSYTFSLVIPSSFDIPNVGTLGVTQATVTAVSGLPAGLSFGNCNPTSCTIPGGTTGCFNIEGTPDASNTPGNFPIQVTVNYEGTVLGLPQNIDLNFPPLSSAFNPLNLPLDPYAITLNANGQCINASNDLEKELSINTNTPNPFKEITTIEIDAEQAGQYDFTVYNLVGERIEMKSIQLNSGENKFEYNGSQLSNGVYVYTISNEKGTVSKKMIVSK